MKRRSFIKQSGAAGLIYFVNPSDIVSPFNEVSNSALEENFKLPPHSALPQTYWFWMNGNVTKEGITLDLEAMKRIGIGGVFNFDVGTGIPKGPIQYLSKEWVELKKHAIREAERLGLEFTMHNCPGWSSSGGPWIKPELAMQQLSWSETYLSGGKTISQSLPKPPNRLDYYNDLAVLAFPSLEGEELLQSVRLSSSSKQSEIEKIKDKDEEGVVVYPSGEKNSGWLQFEFEKPYQASLITFFISAIPNKPLSDKPPEFSERTSVLLESSDDGVSFQTVTKINSGLEAELISGNKFITYDFPLTKARFFRLTSPGIRRYRQVRFSGITRLKHWMEKTNNRARYIMFMKEGSTIETNNDQDAPAGSIVDMNAIIDLSQHVKNGMLSWNAPAGNWTILRVGYTPTGTMNKAAPDTGIGLECDKYNADAISFHFEKMMEQFLPFIKKLTAIGKMGLEIDSYEAGAQNWTSGFEKLFKSRWGYDIIKYLPALAGGRIIGNVDLTERFLWDCRKIQAELIAENYYGRFHKLCKEHGITSYIEPYDMGPMEEMQIGSRADVNIGEFWNGLSSALPIKHPARRTTKLAASIAHINGQKIVGAEAFTADPDSGRWQEYPFAMKVIGDRTYMKGVNRMIIHRFAHQPHPTAVPGMTMGPWGIHFDRTNTWWDQSKGWMDYMARCQYMLQQGRYVADLAYFTGEDANMYTRVNEDQLNPMPPDGYQYDLINAEVILKQARVENKQLVLENGMAYRILVLQDYKAITLSFLKKLREFVREGLAVIGEKPERTPGLSDYANKDEEFKTITDELWGNKNNADAAIHGKGKIYWRRSSESVLKELNIKPDFEFTSHAGNAPIIFTHRRTEEAEVFFLSNQRRTFEDVVCSFRIKNKRPELWDPSTGKILHIGIYEQVDEHVRMPLQFGPYGSLFVVFRSPANQDRIISVEKDDVKAIAVSNFNQSSRSVYPDTINDFTISFWAKPEINILLNPDFIMGSIGEPWTEYYAIYPLSGKKIYGDGHGICGITVGRNGIGVWENEESNPVLVCAAPISISGGSHIALQYKNGTPSVFLNGKFVKEGKKSKYKIHPSLNEAYLNEAASFYNGDMSEPILFKEALSHSRILELSSQKIKFQSNPFVVEFAEGNKPGLIIKENGNYTLNRKSGQKSNFKVTDLQEPLILQKNWKLSFPTSAGTMNETTLQELISLHTHSRENLKYFAGTATYSNTFSISQTGLKSGKHWILDLGRVEVIARVSVNKKDFGILWTRPYSMDITSALKVGINNLEIGVTTLWPNRLIGDEHLPEPDKFSPGGGASGLESLTGGSIDQLPTWYKEGKPKPEDGRSTFSTWKHYRKDSPLVESGLIGPVTLTEVRIRSV